MTLKFSIYRRHYHFLIEVNIKKLIFSITLGFIPRLGVRFDFDVEYSGSQIVFDFFGLPFIEIGHYIDTEWTA